MGICQTAKRGPISKFFIIKLTETWKSLNLNTHKSDAISDLKVVHKVGSREPRFAFKGNLQETGASKKALKIFVNDSTRVWNRAPHVIKNSKSLYSAKLEIKKLSKLYQSELYAFLFFVFFLIGHKGKFTKLYFLIRYCNHYKSINLRFQ